MDTNLKVNNESINNHEASLTEGKEINTMKEEKKRPFLSSTLGTLFMILILTIVSVSSFAPIKGRFQPKNNYIKSPSFAHDLGHLTDYLLRSKVQGMNWYDDRYERIENLQYSITNDDHSIEISNMTETGDPLLLQKDEKHQFYLYVKLDEAGKPKEIESSLGRKFYHDSFFNQFIYNIREDVEETTEESLVSEVNEEEIVMELTDDTHIEKKESPYANLEILYILPDGFEKYDDFFSYSMKEYYLSHYMLLIFIIAAISFLLLSIIAFSISYTKQKEVSISRLFNKMFLELKFVVWIGFPFLFAVLFSELNWYSYGSGFSLAEIIHHTNRYFYLIGIPVTFILLLLAYLTIVYIKYIYYTGFKKGFIENSFVGKVGFNILRKLRRLLKDMMTIDITKDPHKKIFGILVINLLVLWLIALGGVFTFILAVLWSIVLFKYLVTLMVQMKALNDASMKLAKGDFDIQLDEDIGMLKPIATNLNNIKEGFQLAIDKEIKSERMKAQLITNVSHDLKTPLTSIITYIDLLKNPENTQETQKEYIEILDKKSKRLQVLIEDLFEASKATSGNIDLHLEKVDIIALFRQTLGELEEKINESTLEMKINAPDHKIICELDGRRTYRVFENILTNILKYAMANTRVYIDVIEDSHQVNFTFKNISAYEMNFDASEITERFTRGDASRNTEGSGLGLSIAKSFVELQKGSLEIIVDGDLFKLTVTFPKA